MQDNNNDIKKLFQSFGADANNFRELARDADAKVAESRWPLLTSVQPEKRDLPPLLSKAEKSQSWTTPVQHAQRSVKAQGPHHGLGEQLSGSLKKQIQSKQANPVKQEATAPKAGIRTSTPVRTKHQAETTAVVPEKRLFSSASSRGQQVLPKDTVLPEDALSNVFQRISTPIAEKPKSKSTTSKGLFGRLGRS